RKYREAEELVGQASGAAVGRSDLIRYPLDIKRLLITDIREPGSVSARQLGDLAGDIINDAAAASGGDKDDLVIMALAAVRLSQRLDRKEVAIEHLPAVEKLVLSSGHSGAKALLEVAKAEQLRLAGDPDAAAARLLALIDGSEPFQTHV